MHRRDSDTSHRSWLIRMLSLPLPALGPYLRQLQRRRRRAVDQPRTNDPAGLTMQLPAAQPRAVQPPGAPRQALLARRPG